MGTYNIFLVVGHFPVESFPLVHYFFDATHENNRLFLKDKQIFVT